MRTVIVRLFEAAPETGAVGLRGIVEDLGHGTSEPFNGPLELLEVIERAAVPPFDEAAPSTAGEDPTAGWQPGSP